MSVHRNVDDLVAALGAAVSRIFKSEVIRVCIELDADTEVSDGPLLRLSHRRVTCWPRSLEPTPRWLQGLGVGVANANSEPRSCPVKVLLHRADVHLQLFGNLRLGEALNEAQRGYLTLASG